ncbi:MAG: methyltransferase domain-containing protein [Candidatus Rokubacteria bacterium]|nr:methyltransferase domain-containing protein [Candidatus Rokubacteria bacterium]
MIGLSARLEGYYTRYYRDTLGIPGWRELVAVRLADQAYEGRRLDRLERALGRSVLGCRLLNVGCGTGGFNAVAARAGAAAWGVDADPEAAAIARARVGEGRILCGPAEALPFREGSFDVVYCYSTLEHVVEARQALHEMVRVLRPHGVLYLHTPNRWAWFESHYKVFWIPGLPRRVARAYLTARGRPTAFLETLQPRTLTECRRILAETGARITRVLDEDARRPVGGPLWPLVRLSYRLFGVRPYVELVAIRGEDT